MGGSRFYFAKGVCGIEGAMRDKNMSGEDIMEDSSKNIKPKEVIEPQQEAENLKGNVSYNKPMEVLDRHEIEKIISEAKLETSEGRLRFCLWFGGIFLAVVGILLSIFGIAFPLWLNSQLTDKVDTEVIRMQDTSEKLSSKLDTEIEKMETKFNELAGKQLRKAKIACYVDGENLLNSTVVYGPHFPQKEFIIFNEGDGTADYIKVYLYVDQGKDEWFPNQDSTGWEKYLGSDNPEFEYMLKYEFWKESRLPARDFMPIYLEAGCQRSQKEDIRARAMLKIFYDEPVPVEIPFTLELKAW